jgi:polygalacturonase
MKGHRPIKRQSRGLVFFAWVASLQLLVLLSASLAFSQTTGDSRWPGLNATVPEPSFPALCTQVVGSNGEPAGVLYANQTAGSITQTPDSRLQNAIDTCQPAPGQPAVGLELEASGSYNAFVIGLTTLQPGVTLLVDTGVVVFAATGQPYGNGVITVAPNTGASATQYTGGAMGYWGIMGYGIIDGQGSAWGWNGAGPRLIQLGTSSSNSADYFTLYKITLQNPGMYHVYGVGNDFLAYDVKITTAADTANTDGIDPSGSNNVTIVNSFISDGDDHVAIKASVAPVTNITIAHDHLYSGHGMSVGSETNAGVSNLLVTDLAIDNNGGYGSGSKNSLRIKSDASRGGEVQNVLYDGVCIQNGGHIFVFDPYYSSSSGKDYPDFHGITLQNLHVLDHDSTGHNGNSTLQGYLTGSISYPLGITMDNVVFDGYSPTNMATEFAAVASDKAGNNSGIRNAVITLGPDPVNLNTVLDAYTGIDEISVFDNTGSSGNPPYDCTSKFTYLAGELFGSTRNVTAGSTVTLTAIVQPTVASSWNFSPAYVSPAPSGTITIYDNGTQVASQTAAPPAVSYQCYDYSSLCSSKRSVNTVSIPNVSAGTHVYTASYSGDSFYLPSDLTSGVAAVGSPSGGEVPVAPTFPFFTVQASGTSTSPAAIVTAAGKTYDGTTTEPIANLACTLLPSESNVTCAAAAATFASANAGTGIMVTATGISLSGTSASNYTLASTTATTIASITPATPSLVLICTEVIYDGNPHSCTGSATGVGGAAVSGTWSFSPASAVKAGSYPVTGTFTSNDPNYLSAGTATAALIIDAKPVTPTVTAAGKPYDGTNTEPLSNITCLPHVLPVDQANVSCAGTAAAFSQSGAGTSLTVTVTGITLSGTAAANYALSTTTAGSTAAITATSPALSLTCAAAAWDGNPHGCTGTATGIGGVTVAGSFSFNPGSETALGSYLETGTFTSTDPNYASGGTATGTLVIEAASQSPSVACPGPLTYDGNAHLCTITGGIGACTSASVTNVPGSTTLALTCAGDGNHNSWSGTGSIVINPATPTLAASCVEVAYDGSAHSCTGIATGIGGAAVSGSFAFSPGSEINVGSYPEAGEFTSADSNYASGGSVSGTLQIDRAGQSPTVSCPGPLTYDGNAHGCTITGGFGTCTSGVVTNVPGGSVALNCAGDSNHIVWSGFGSITINQASQVSLIQCRNIAWTSAPVSPCSGAPGAAVTYTQVISGPIAALTSGSSSTLTLTGTGAASVLANYGATQNYSAGSATKSFTVTVATPVIACQFTWGGSTTNAGLPPNPTYGDTPIPFTCSSGGAAPPVYKVTGGTLQAQTTMTPETLIFSKAGPLVLTVSEAKTEDNTAKAASYSTTVAQYQVTITADPQTWNYGQPEPILTYSTGTNQVTVVPGDAQPTFSFKLTDGSGAAMTKNSPLGTYNIVPVVKKISPNYVVAALNPGIMTYQAVDVITTAPEAGGPLDFKDTLAGTTQAAKLTVKITNQTGAESLTITPAPVADFTVTNTTSGQSAGSCTAARGKTCTFSIAFTPQKSDVGPLSELLILNITDTGSGDPNSSVIPASKSWTLTGNSLGAFTATAPVFPNTENKQTSEQPVLVTNNSEFSIISIAGKSSSKSFVVATDGTNTCLQVTAANPLTQGMSCNLTVIFTPLPDKGGAGGAYSGTLTVSAKGQGLTTDTLTPVPVQLTAQDIAWVNYTPAAGALNFPGTGGAKVTDKITVTNNTDGTITLNPGLSGVSATPASVTTPFTVTNGCSASVAAGASCTISVASKLPVGGAASGTLSFTDPVTGSKVFYTLSAGD